MEIHNTDNNNQVLGNAHVYKVKRRRVLKDGTVKLYETSVNYIPKTDREVIDDETKQKIIADYNFGLAKTKIAKKYNITPYRVNNIIKKIE
jgi:Mor family transcriptional regulator